VIVSPILLEGVDRWCWGRVGMSIEVSCLCKFPLWSASLRVPFGLGKCVIVWYIVVALSFVGVNVIGFIGCVS
jgi:hypothetical protein